MTACFVGTAGCDRPDAASSPLSDQPRDVPYKTDEGPTDVELFRVAYTIQNPAYDHVGRLPPVGDIKCIVRKARLFDFEGQRFGLTVSFVAKAQDCSGPNAILLSLVAAGKNDKLMEDGERLVVQVAGSSYEFGSGVEPGYVGGVPPIAMRREQRVEHIHTLLGELVGINPVTADQFPAWPETELQPSLVEGTLGELTFQPFVDRQTYEAARHGRKVTLCWKYRDRTSLRCVAEAERRRPAQITLFAVHGWGAFTTANQQRVLKTIAGELAPRRN